MVGAGCVHFLVEPSSPQGQAHLVHQDRMAYVLSCAARRVAHRLLVNANRRARCPSACRGHCSTCPPKREPKSCPQKWVAKKNTSTTCNQEWPGLPWADGPKETRSSKKNKRAAETRNNSNSVLGMGEGKMHIKRKCVTAQPIPHPTPST